MAEYPDFGLYRDIYTSFENGLCKVKSYDKKWGYIDCTGEEIVPIIYDHVERFEEGLAQVSYTEDDERYVNFVNTNGHEILDHHYFNFSSRSFHEGIAFAGYIDSFDDKQWYMIDKLGNKTYIGENFYNVIVSGRFLYVTIESSEGYKVGICDKKGHFIVPTSYKNIYWADKFDGVFTVKDINGKYGFIKENGQTLLSCSYEDAGVFVNGYAWVKLNGKCTIIDKNGKDIFCE